MRISIFGAGYVGLASGLCLAEHGHEILLGDRDRNRVAQLSAGHMPLREAQMAELLQRHLASGQLRFTCDPAALAAAGDICIVAVGTPPTTQGAADLNAVEAVFETLAAHTRGYTVVLVKSTVPVGTCRRLNRHVAERMIAHRNPSRMDVVSNPEFFREGSAMLDCLQPERIVLGFDASLTQPRGKTLIKQLFVRFVAARVPLLWMDSTSSEMTKYAANAMLATKISFMNEMATMCAAVGADVLQVKAGVAADSRIGPHNLAPGLGFGGSCLPKDVRALLFAAQQQGIALPLLQAVQNVNDAQKQYFYGMLENHFEGHFSQRRIAVWGLAFKPGTDDVRDAPALSLITALLAAGASVCAFDPVANIQALTALAPAERLTFADDAYAAVRQADALCILTEWPIFATADMVRVAGLMRQPMVFDGRHALATCKSARSAGLTVMALHRPQSEAQAAIATAAKSQQDAQNQHPMADSKELEEVARAAQVYLSASSLPAQTQPHAH